VNEATGNGLLYGDLTQTILGAFYDVYNQLGAGFLESVYEAALEIDLKEAGLKVKRQAETQVFFRTRHVGKFLADIIVEDLVIIELKAVRAITSSHEAQLVNLLKATNLEVGLILNFGPQPVFRRLVYSNANKPFHHERPRIHADPRG
jgi:GxxExxY protein